MDTRQAVTEGSLIVAGIAPEQHGERMALFLQWKQMEEMPVMIDSYNVLGLKAVPITLLIDEAGIIRYRNPSREELKQFLDAPAAPADSAPPAPRPVTLQRLSIIPIPEGDPSPASGHRSYPPARVVMDGDRKPDDKELITAITHFQTGVALRKRYDSDSGRINDFRNAVGHWQAALDLDPGNYIWRRRLQQYGPRLDKPYPFYDWINQARVEITARGETPRPLLVEPHGSEVARPQRKAEEEKATNTPPHPDPDNRLPRDDNRLFNHLVSCVPHTDKKTEAFRVFVDLKPARAGIKWNDEAGLSSLRVTAPPGWSVHPEALNFLPASGAPPDALRSVDFELRRTSPGNPSTNSPSPRLLFQFFLHTCHGSPEICQFLRLDVDHKIEPWQPANLSPPAKR